MSDQMGTFRIDIELENPARSGARAAVRQVLVDTGSELSWVPAAILASNVRASGKLPVPW